ncbi:MAG TPA: folylpolyglutamate synthase/dihydrofolate synthase family protein [Solirubrobacteraceae bacterium]|nr:folylpolyglutamate synthase/dihydrofolate synthase family protein [Solirubrobacteraceae bacterium]
MRPDEAEQRLLSLELFGMRFGLDRMRRLMTALGHPERQFKSIHVVGTNGKSSTTRMTAAILARHGYRVGAYLSPHLVSYNERVRIDDADLTPQRFADAIERALNAAERVNRTEGDEDRVTQFELLTAAAYSELAAQHVDVAVIEAGLGGRYDATNVIPSSVQILTGVGLEHTRWLGSTITDIAREKLDVVRPGATLVLGPELHPDALAVAREVAAERGATIVQAEADPHAAVGALGTFQRRNFAVARTAAEAFLGHALDEQAVAAAAADVRVPGRLQIAGERPLTLLDGAHNPDGIAALAESLPEIVAAHRREGGRLVALVSILDDKDASGMLATLAPLCDALILTASRNPRVLPPPTLQSLLQQSGAKVESEIVAEPHAALARARELAGRGGVVVATGSIYLIAYLLTDPAQTASRRASTL